MRNDWTYPADVRVITTNGTVKQNGQAVMGRGCAREAVAGVDGKCGGWPGLPDILGAHLEDGNHVYFLGACVTPAKGVLYSFPVKHRWFERADMELIQRSAHELLSCINDEYPEITGKPSADCHVVMPRPGCGNGKLRWLDVRPLLANILDDRFRVISFGDQYIP